MEHLVKDENLTKEELLFLILLNNDYSHDDYVVSEFSTEQGIQSVLNCDLGLVSRIVRKNEKRGYIKRKKAKIKNKKRKQNAFYLTTKGHKFALKINELTASSELK